MINIEIKNSNIIYYDVECSGSNCKRLPKYIFCDSIIHNLYYIKKDSICGRIDIKGSAEYYCYDCLDDLYKFCKLKLDKRLWSFH
jgi:hypothetical protein